MNDDAVAPRTQPLTQLPWLAQRLQQQTHEQSSTGTAHEPGRNRDKHVRHIAFLNDLIRQIDMVIYCQISVLCYLDCSLWRFMLRFIPQWLLASDPQTAFLLSNLTTRPYLVNIVFTNIVCAFLHLVLDPPAGTELSRGYIHGGFLIDFVGEPAPASRWKMLLIDMCIFILQLLLLATILEQRELKLSTEDPALLNLVNRIVGRTQGQDLDAEEQGIRRSQEINSETAEDEAEEGDVISDSSTDDSPLIDISYGGQMVIMTFNLRRTIVKAWQRHLGVSSRQSRT